MSETIETEPLIGDSEKMKETSKALAEKVRKVTRSTADFRKQTEAFAAALDAVFDENPERRGVKSRCAKGSRAAFEVFKGRLAFSLISSAATPSICFTSDARRSPRRVWRKRDPVKY